MKKEKKISTKTDRLKNFMACFALLLLTIIFLVIQFGRLSAPTWDEYESWRQTDTYSIARNYVHFGMSNPLSAMLNYDGTSHNYSQLELQIMPYLSAVIFKMTGLMTSTVCRFLSLLFFIGSAIFFLLLLCRMAGPFEAVIGYGIYLFLPLSMLTASSVQPESCALFFLCGGIYFLYRYKTSEKLRFLMAASVMTAVAIMEKTPTAFVGLIFLYVLISVMGKDFYKNPRFYICGCVTLLPPIFFIFYSSRHSIFRFVDGIAVKHIFSKEIFSIFTKEGVQFFCNSFAEYFGWPVIVLSVLGIVVIFQKKCGFLLAWTVAFILECVTVVAVIKFSYYLVFILPVCAMLSAVAIRDILTYRKAAVAVVCVFILFSLCSHVNTVWKKTAEITYVGNVGRFIAENTQFDDGIAIGEMNPAYLNAADRRGYRANLKYYDYIPTEPEDEISYFIEHGVKYLVICNGYITGDDGEYLSYVQNNFPVYAYAENENCVIYDLTQKKGEIQ